ncbi:MAG: capsular biosynthesis protein [Planctomycetes bacterium]|nr:capsular biosynthesis protein [Planctomycetota bacterium]
MPKCDVILLQGPIGPFFRGLARELSRRGYRVVQVCCNGGDEWFAAHELPWLRFQGRRDDCAGWLNELLKITEATRVVLFGDERPLHVVARKVCDARRIAVWVVEEGYLRPHYLTFEQGGVNANSRLPRDPAEIGRWQPRELPPPRAYQWVMLRRIMNCIIYYTALAWHRRRYPHYRHHRRTRLVPEALIWVRACVRRYWYAISERRVLPLVRQHQGPRFLLPLQVHNDIQMTVHSDFASVAAVIVHVVRSFVQHAAANALLIIKHHPMDRGYTDYRQLVQRLRKQYALQMRLVYCHDQPLPTLLSLVDGVVTVNSTVGISALLHGVPVICLGRAHYDIPGLTHQEGLASFWTRPEKPNQQLFKRYHSLLREQSQLNASSASEHSSWDLLDRLPAWRAVTM